MGWRWEKIFRSEVADVCTEALLSKHCPYGEGAWDHGNTTYYRPMRIQQLKESPMGWLTFNNILEHPPKTNQKAALLSLIYGKRSGQWRPFDLLILVNYQWIAGSSYPELKRLERNLSWQLYQEMVGVNYNARRRCCAMPDQWPAPDRPLLFGPRLAQRFNLWR